jgi:hypothetical protein
MAGFIFVHVSDGKVDHTSIAWPSLSGANQYLTHPDLPPEILDRAIACYQSRGSHEGWSWVAMKITKPAAYALVGGLARGKRTKERLLEARRNVYQDIEEAFQDLLGTTVDLPVEEMRPNEILDSFMGL